MIKKVKVWEYECRCGTKYISTEPLEFLRCHNCEGTVVVNVDATEVDPYKIREYIIKRSKEGVWIEKKGQYEILGPKTRDISK